MRFYLFILSVFLVSATVESAEPMIVLDYSQHGDVDELPFEFSNHPFRVDPNHSQSHKVMPDETLGHIMQDYYGGSGLNMNFVELAIVQFNKHR